MTTIEERVAALRRRQSALLQSRAASEHARNVATAQVEAARQALQEEFGITTLEQARTALGTLEQQIAAECTRVEQALAAAGGGA